MVQDGIITKAEKELILKIAKEDNIPEDEAKIYLIGEKKKVISKKDKPSTFMKVLEVAGKIGGALVVVGGGVFKLLEVITAFNDVKDNGYRCSKKS